MTTIYWSCLLGGVAVSVLLVFLGDVLEAAMDALDGALEALDVGGAFDPLSAVFGVTLFGGAGLLLDAYTDLGTIPEVTVAAVIGVVAAVALHIVYVKPMKASENSTGFSVREYSGKTGELTTGVPENGFGEVVVRMGASTTFQTAASFSGDPIPTGTPVVVVEVDREGVLRVAPLDREDLMVPPVPPARLQSR
ncbi:protease [Rubrivirga sp. IMCC45206]|uniref:protease n=1 Tax=Rubrivirga sp. IMCC45206 TaxID=3391614 RepID=UPI00398FF859